MFLNNSKCPWETASLLGKNLYAEDIHMGNGEFLLIIIYVKAQNFMDGFSFQPCLGGSRLEISHPPRGKGE